MRTRDLLRFVPGLSKLAHALTARERENRLLTEECWRLAGENHRLKARSGARPARTEPGAAPPLPPEVLRLMVAGTGDAEWFLTAGKRAADSLAALLARNGVALEECEAVLDFGCGCGRVLRHLTHLPAALHGCDSNPVGVEWCAEHLPTARFAVNALESSLDYDAGSFDVAYALSVLTHLPQPLQFHWMRELRRVLKPGGLLVVSLHGDALVGKLNRAERADYRAGRLVVRSGELAGTNHCAVFHPPAFVRGVLADGFEVLEHAREGAKGNPPQDAWVLRRK
ncbi:class I SAM-dependent methyltransferase [Gemmata sp. JC673]|uniref:Class I SAM-dependent methyltransferase n=1 Tax=Gemmata algarum TaxID=2975278 RepID=A0ABU5EU87_9BACT|nr:class I SAM-dependent methyltransferase [Gemmata algarum]MDY3558676.1 class I SAM-dependent methyltransferase [Gemmata algarum]